MADADVEAAEGASAVSSDEAAKEALQKDAATGRANERNRLVRLGVILSGVERVVTMGNALLRVGLLAYLLSNRDYGLYVAVLGVVATANLLDFGLHYGVVTAVSRAYGEDDMPLVGAILSTGAAIYSAIAALAFVVVIPVFLFGPIDWVFGLAPDQVSLARVIAVIGFGGLLLAMPMKVANAGLLGFQLTYVTSAYRSASGIVGTLLLAATALAWRGHVVPVAVVTALTDLGGGLFLWTWFAWKQRHRFRISLRNYERRLVPSLLGTGLTFFLANLANLLKRSFVTVAISHSLGTAAVPGFSVPLALFTTGLAFTDIAATSLWPAYGEAAARRDWSWVERAFRVSTRATFFAAVLISVLGTVSGDEVIRIWTVKIPAPSTPMLAWFALWVVAQAAIGTGSSLLNGIGKSRHVMFVTMAEGALTFFSTVAFVRYFGVVGTAAAMALSGTATGLYLHAIAIPRSTDAKVSGELGTLVRIAPFAAGAVLLGLFVAHPVNAVLPRLVLGAVVAFIVFGGGLWTVVMSPAERARIGEVVAARLSSRKRASSG